MFGAVSLVNMENDIRVATSEIDLSIVLRPFNFDVALSVDIQGVSVDVSQSNCIFGKEREF